MIDTNRSTFVLIYVKCPFEVAAERDPKGLYEQAKAGEIDKFTGINHPFKEPVDTDIVVDTVDQDLENFIRHVLVDLAKRGVFRDAPKTDYAFDISDQEEENIKELIADRGYLV